jgi:hypothetical protein
VLACRYRTAEEMKVWRARDPVARFRCGGQVPCLSLSSCCLSEPACWAATSLATSLPQAVAGEQWVVE